MFLNLSLLAILLIHDVGSVNENQIKEAAKLRAELTEKLSPELKVTPGKQAEIDAIRNEILNAVNNQKYTPSDPQLGQAPKASNDVKDPILATPLWNRINHSRKNIYELVSSKQPEKEMPKNIKFLGKFNLHSNAYRDIIDLVEVQESLKFECDKVVHVWRTIPHSMSGNKHLLLGLTNHTLVLAKLVDGQYQFVDELKISDNVLNHNGFEAFLHWNNKDGESEGYAVVASNDELIWVRLGASGEYNKLEIKWNWPIHRTINKFKYFRHNNESLIFLANQNAASLDIYRFSLDNKEFSQIQIIRLSVPSKNIALVEWKKQILLALPLENTTEIYRYSDKFSLIKTVQSKGVTSVSGFQAGGLCFFAIAGEEPQILRYRHNGLNKVDVLSKTYQFVRTYVPISIHTFRDDVILLVQFEVHFDTHTLSRISTLRWNGVAFETFFNVPCKIDDTPHYSGISCLLEGNEGLGLSGSVILTKSNNVSILVPRKNTKSGLFEMKIEIRAAPHPKEEKLIEFQMMFDYFSSLKEYNALVLHNAEEAIKNAVLPDKEMVVTGEWSVDILDAKNVVPDEGLIKHKNNSEAVDVDLVAIANETVYKVLNLENTVKKAVPKEKSGIERIGPEELNSPVKLHKVHVEEIYCENINGIPSNAIVWRLEDVLKFDFPLEVQSMSILNIYNGSVNGLNLNNDLVHAGSPAINGNVTFENLQVERLSSSSDINGGLLEVISRNGNHLAKITAKELYVDDLLVNQINGIDWVSAEKEMIRIDAPSRNINLSVKGNMIIEGDANIELMNGNPFVSNYIWDESEEFLFVAGKKEFREPVVASTIDMEDSKIDGVSLNRLISLGGGAYIPDETIFGDHLELVHGLIVTNSSSIEGPYMDMFLSNPTLQQERIVQAACDFRNLRVEGKVIVTELLNGIDIKSELAQYIYQTEQPMQVNGFKDIKAIQMNDLQTDLVNGKDMSSFVTLNHEQSISLSQLVGSYFRFDHMRLYGLFDFVNISDLVDKSIRTTGDQATEAHIIMDSSENGNPFQLSLTARNIQTQNTLNTFPVDKFVDNTNILEYTGLIEGAEVTVKRLFLAGNLRGAPIINGHHIPEYDAQRWSKSRDQTVTAPVFVKNMFNLDFQFTRINSVGHQELMAGLRKVSDFGDQFMDHFINEMHISAEAKFNYINGEDFRHLLSNVIWLNQSNELSHDITCLDELLSEDRIAVKGHFNSRQDFLRRIVWKNQEQEVRLKGRITFQKGFVVEGSVRTKHVNGIAVENFLTKNNPLVYEDVILNSGLKVHSMLTAPVWNMFGNFEARQLFDLYKYNHNTNTHQVYTERVTFNTAAVIAHLDVGGGLNDIPDIGEFLSSIQPVDSPTIILQAAKTNLQKISFVNLQVEFINGVSLEEFLTHAVLRSEVSATKQIKGKVQFSNSIESSHIDISELTVYQINGLNGDHCFMDSILLSQPKLWENLQYLEPALHKLSSIRATTLNGVLFDKYDLTNRDRHLLSHAKIKNMVIDSFVAVSGLVNDHKLEPEMQNTLLKFSPLQTISTRATFDSIRVMNTLTIEGQVSGRNLSLIILNNGKDISIESPTSFTHLQAFDLRTNHLVNGLDFNAWYKDAVKYYDTALQTINGYWQVKHMRVKGSIQGENSINGNNLKSFLNAYDSNHQHLQQYQSVLQFAYWKMCSMVKDYFSSPLRVGCSFKHLEEQIPLNFAEVSALLVFRHINKYYLMISSGCLSRLYLWGDTDFVEVDSIASGHIVEWTYVPANSAQLHLVAKNGAFCPNVVQNTVWAWNREKRLVAARQIATDVLSDVLTSPQKRNFFYRILEGRVQEIKIPELTVTNEWLVQERPPLPLRFLPPSHDSLEVLVTNGVDIHRIYIKPSNRYKRHWLNFGTRSKRLEENYRLINELAFMNKTAFLKVVKEAIKNQKMKIVSKLVRPTGAPIDHGDTRNIDSNPANTTDNPTVGGAIFDDIQNTIRGGVELFTDSSADVLKHFDAKYDIEGILDALEDRLLKSPDQSVHSNSEIVGGALFDDLQSLSKDGADLFVDVSAKVVSDLDRIIDLEEFLEETVGNVQSGEDIHVGNQSVDYGSYSGTDNSRSVYSPNILSSDGEVVALNVGAGRQLRTLYAVYNSKKATPDSDLILIYENLFIDRPFQTISCYKPSSLTAWQMDQETLLIFLEDKIKVQIYVFRGMIGFKPYLQVALPYAVDFLRTAILPWAPCRCLSHFLTAVSKKNVMLLKAETVGNCINEVIECNEY